MILSTPQSKTGLQCGSVAGKKSLLTRLANTASFFFLVIISIREKRLSL